MEQSDNKSSSFISMNNRWFVAILAALIIIVAVFLRAGLLHNQGLFEPDGFFYYAVIQATIANNLHVPATLFLSGFPAHNPIGEAHGLILLTAIPAALLARFGISALSIMRNIPILFGVLEAILAFFIAKKLSKSNALGLLAMGFIAVSSGNIARTAGTVYRGDSFISLFLMVALLIMIEAISREHRDKLFIGYALLAAFVLSLGVIVWNGSPFIIAIYMLALLLLLVYALARADSELLAKNSWLAGALALTFVLENAYVHMGIANAGLPLEGLDFFVFYIPIILGSISAWWIISKDRFSLATNARLRNFVLLVIIVAGLIGMTIYLSVHNTKSLTALGIGTATSVCGNTNSTAVTNESISCAVGGSTQELQKVSFSFIFSSFGMQLFLAPLGVVLFLLFATAIDETRHRHHNEMRYLNITPIWLILLSYFGIAAVLQYSAIRYNALLSIPMALFAAYGVFALYRLLHSRKLTRGTAIIAAVVVLAILLIYVKYAFITTLSNLQNVANAGSYRPIVIGEGIGSIATLVAMVLAIGYALLAAFKSAASHSFSLGIVIILLVLAMFIFGTYITYATAFTATQADGVNPQFLTAMQWIRTNTPANATFLDVWPDGSVIEGWGNRTAYVDSVGGEDAVRLYRVASFLFNTSSNGQHFLYSIGKPGYIVSREFWFAELAGLAQEGLISNATAYGQVTLTPSSIQHNGSITYYLFEGSPYRALLITKPYPNSTAINYTAYIGTTSSTTYAVLKHLLFYNTSNNGYTLITSGLPSALNYTLEVQFSGASISGAQILGPKLLGSNFFALTTLCNTAQCPFDSNSVSLKLVYVNSDTRVYKIVYNSTTG